MENEKRTPRNWMELARAIHGDQRGAVTIETVLIIAAIALPVLIFILKFGWPKIRDFFNRGMDDLDGSVKGVNSGTS